MYFPSDIERLYSMTGQSLNYCSSFYLDKFPFAFFDVEYFGVNFLISNSNMTFKLYLKPSDYFKKFGDDDKTSMHTRTIEAFRWLSSFKSVPLTLLDLDRVNEFSLVLLDYGIRTDNMLDMKISINFRYFFDKDKATIPFYSSLFTCLGFHELERVSRKSMSCLARNTENDILFPINILGFLIDQNSLLGAKVYLTNSVKPGLDVMDNTSDEQLYRNIWSMVNLWKISDDTRLKMIIDLLREHCFKVAFFGIDQSLLSGISYKLYFRTRNKSEWTFDDVFSVIGDITCDFKRQMSILYSQGYFVEIFALLFIHNRISGLQFYFKKFW